MPQFWRVNRDEKAHWRQARWDGWELVWQVVDAWACPRCGDFVRGKLRYLHERDHERVDTAITELSEAVAVVARKVGLEVRGRDDDELLQEAEPVAGVVVGGAAYNAYQDRGETISAGGEDDLCRTITATGNGTGRAWGISGVNRGREWTRGSAFQPRKPFR